MSSQYSRLPVSVQEICAAVGCRLDGLELYVSDDGLPLVSPAIIGEYVGQQLAFHVANEAMEAAGGGDVRLPLRSSIIDLISAVAKTTEHYANLRNGP